MLGIVTALPVERRWLGVIDGRLGPAVEVCGAGSRRAREAAHRLLAGGATALASWGTAAGLQAALGAGTVVLPRQVLCSGSEIYEVDHDWQRRLLDRLDEHVTVSTGPLVHASVLLETVAAKTDLGARTGAVAADMESSAVAAAAAAAGLPFLVVRVVLDDVASALPTSVTRALDSAGRLRPAGMWRDLLTHPEEWRLLLELARSYRRARRAMRELWRRAGPDLALGEVPHIATDAAGSASL
jgi:adenosylhomocysteine nucleosidase